MKTHNYDYPEYKTARQWARAGYLPTENAQGVELWANRNCQNKYTYYSPAEVEPASPERLREYFAPERERRNQRERERRAELRELREREKMYAAERQARELTREHIRESIEQLTARYSKEPPTLDRVLIVDTETTGLEPSENEILQLSIIDGNGTELYNGYFLPCAREWREAQAVNHISPADVQNAPRLSAELPRISEIFARAHKIIGYNLPFDLSFLECSGVLVPAAAERIDVMQLFAPIYGEYSEKYGGYKWQKLTKAAAYYGYDWNEHGSAHDSRADCYATLFVYNKIIEGGTDKAE